MTTSDERNRQAITGNHHPDAGIREIDGWRELRIELILLGLAVACLYTLAT